MRHRARMGALMLIAVGVLLGATVFGDDIAQAAQGIVITNTESQAVPVREQSLDANGDVKVHEQGTADVNVTNQNAVPVHEQGTARVSVANTSVLVQQAGDPVTINFGRLPGNTYDVPSGKRLVIQYLNDLGGSALIVYEVSLDDGLFYGVPTDSEAVLIDVPPGYHVFSGDSTEQTGIATGYLTDE